MTTRQKALAVLLAVAALVLAFLLGRGVRPEPEIRVEVREIEKVVEKRVEVAVQQAAEVRTRVVYRDRLVQPDGTVREREIEREDNASTSQQATAAAEVRETERIVEQRVEVLAPAPRWRVGALVGVDLRAPLASPAFGARVDYRLVGPVSVGAWGLSSGVGGVGVTLELP